MPFVDIVSTAGPARVWCTISTPTEAEAEQIEPGRPCLVFLHPVYCASSIWHPQLLDPALRRFNVIALDARMHGRTEGLVKENFDFNDAADDVYHVLKALSIPPCILVGLSMGATVAIRMTALYPAQCKGLFLVSLLPPVEVLAAGRREVWETFAEGIRTDDPALMELGASGAAQLAFGDAKDPFIQRIFPATVRLLAKSDPAVLRGRHLITVELFINRGGLTEPELRRIKDCPVKMLWASEDVAYDLGSMREKKRDLDEGGLEVELIEVEGAPHFASVTHPHKINPLLLSFAYSRFPSSKNLPAPDVAAVQSPFERFLDPLPAPAKADGVGKDGGEASGGEESDDEEGGWV